MRKITNSKKLSLLLLFVCVASLTLLPGCAGSHSTSSTFPGSGQSNTFVYVSNLIEGAGPSGTVYTGSGGISEFQMASNGVLTKVTGSPLSFNSNTPTALAADPLGRFLFGASANNIFTFSIQPKSGALTQVASTTLPPAASGDFAGGPLVVDHAGNFLYALTLNGINAYSIGSSGALTSMQTITTAVDLLSSGLALDSAGKYLYAVTVGNTGTGIISPTVFSVDSASGMLTKVSSFPSYQFGTAGLAVNPNGTSVYVLTASPIANLVFANNNGTITQVQDTGCGCDTDHEGKFVLVHPSGKFLYEVVSNELIGLTINSDGTLGSAISPFTGFPLTPTPGVNVAIALDPGGNFLFASQSLLTGTNSTLTTPVVTEFAVDASTGNLRQISGSPFMLDVMGSDPFATVAVAVPQ
jgi:6-phosphogluconolactonase (cycloisomerase 2 family)